MILANKKDLDAKLIVSAFEFSNKAHMGQYRKGTSIPYISHPMAVAAIVMECGGNSLQIAAALLHDVLEDTDCTPKKLNQIFGHKIVKIVKDLSDSTGFPKPPWKVRKKKYLEHLLNEASDDAILISVADKLHNLRSTNYDAALAGKKSAGFWSRFNAGKQDIFWYYQQLARVFEHRILQKRFPNKALVALVDVEFRGELKKLKHLVK